MLQIDTITPDIPQALWLNKDSIQRVIAVKERAGNGSLTVESFVIPGGLPIVIGTKEGVMPRADFEALQQHNATNLGSFQITLFSKSWTVIWDNTEGPAVTGVDVFDEVDGYQYLEQVTLKFLTAEA